MKPDGIQLDSSYFPRWSGIKYKQITSCMCSKQAIQDYRGSLEYQLHQEAKEKVDNQVWVDKPAQKEVEVILDQ